MGSGGSKKLFSDWDLIEFSKITGIPQSMLERIYKDFLHITGNDNKIDKSEFRRLFKKMYVDGQATSLPSALPAFVTAHELNKMADYVFEAYDFHGTGTLTFEEFAEAYLMLTHRADSSSSGFTFRDRFNYILEQDNPTPGFITREQAERVFNRLQKYKDWINTNHAIAMHSTTPPNSSWEAHWKILDNGSGLVPKHIFLDYVSNLDEYKRYFDPGVA